MTDASLDGLVVADFTRVLAGPYATMMLGDMGARVIKIERPYIGDDTRSWGPPVDAEGQATYFLSVNRNKKSVTIDLGSEAGRAEALEIISTADIVVENFRAGTMDRFGLGYAQIKNIRPDIVYCSITGFGSSGGAALAGYDLLIQAVGGLMSVTGSDEEHPTKVGVAVVDVLTGLHALAGILAALRHRDRTGVGQWVQTNLLSTSLSSLVNQASGYIGAGVVPKAIGNRHPSIAPYEVYPTADRPIVLAVGNDKQFAALAETLGATELSCDPRFIDNASRVANRDSLYRAVAGLLKIRPADDWFTLLNEAGVPAGPINTVAEAFKLAERLGLPTTVRVPGSPSPQVVNPISMSETPVQYRLGPPRLLG